MTEKMDQSLEIIELREELQRTKLLLQNCNGDIVRADRELASLREQLAKKHEAFRDGWLARNKKVTELKEVIRQLIPMAQKHIDLLDGYKGWIEGDPNETIPDWYAKLPGYKAIIEKAKSLTTKAQPQTEGQQPPQQESEQ